MLMFANIKTPCCTTCKYTILPKVNCGSTSLFDDFYYERLDYFITGAITASGTKGYHTNKIELNKSSSGGTIDITINTVPDDNGYFYNNFVATGVVIPTGCGLSYQATFTRNSGVYAHSHTFPPGILNYYGKRTFQTPPKTSLEYSDDQFSTPMLPYHTYLLPYDVTQDRCVPNLIYRGDSTATPVDEEEIEEYPYPTYKLFWSVVLTYFSHDNNFNLNVSGIPPSSGYLRLSARATHPSSFVGHTVAVEKLGYCDIIFSGAPYLENYNFNFNMLGYLHNPDFSNRYDMYDCQANISG